MNAVCPDCQQTETNQIGYCPTCDRITNDLEKERRKGDWVMWISLVGFVALVMALFVHTAGRIGVW